MISCEYLHFFLFFGLLVRSILLLNISSHEIPFATQGDCFWFIPEVMVISLSIYFVHEQKYYLILILDAILKA